MFMPEDQVNDQVRGRGSGAAPEANNPTDGEEDILQEDGWNVIDSFFVEKGMAHQQIGSFDDFMSYRIQEAVDR